MSTQPKGTILCTWNQSAIRDYICQVRCFPFSGDISALLDLQVDFQRALSVICQRIPAFAGEITLGNNSDGRVAIRVNPCDSVTVCTQDSRAVYPWTYTELQNTGFPARAFIGDLFQAPRASLEEDDQSVPATEIHLKLIQSGLLVVFFVHHSITDGVGVSYMADMLAECLNSGDKMSDITLPYPTDIDVELCSLSNNTISHNESEIIHLCPELTLGASRKSVPEEAMPKDTVPIPMIPKAAFGVIFTIGIDKIRFLKKIAGGNTANGNIRNVTPSTFACIATLVWSFCTASRLKTALRDGRKPAPKCLKSDMDKSNIASQHARLMIPTSWRNRAFQDKLSNYCGNAVIPVLISHDLAKTQSLTSHSFLSISELHDLEAVRDFGATIQQIERGVAAVDEEYVRLRYELYRTAVDPSQIGYNFDINDARDFFVNNLRHLAGQKPWKLRGAVGVHPDAIRQGAGHWGGLSGATILPKRPDTDTYEVLVTLDDTSMTHLTSNEQWLTWIDRVIW